MWWKIILGVIGLAVVGFIGMVIKMAVTDAKEETKDIERASTKSQIYLANGCLYPFYHELFGDGAK